MVPGAESLQTKSELTSVVLDVPPRRISASLAVEKAAVPLLRTR